MPEMNLKVGDRVILHETRDDGTKLITVQEVDAVVQKPGKKRDVKIKGRPGLTLDENGKGQGKRAGKDMITVNIPLISALSRSPFLKDTSKIKEVRGNRAGLRILSREEKK